MDKVEFRMLSSYRSRSRALLKSAVLRTARHFGFERVSQTPVDLSGQELLSACAFERNPKRPFLVDVPIARLRDLSPAALCMPDNPFFHVCRDYLARGHSEYAGSGLEAYYSRIPRSAADLIPGGLTAAQSAVASFPCLQIELPWFSASGPKVATHRMETARRHAREHGMNEECSSAPYLFGPIPEAKGRFEMFRTLKTLNSIQTQGYRIKSMREHIRGYLLIGERPENYCVLIMSGTHRAPVLAALGHTTAPVLIYPHNVIRLSELNRWPGVVSGDFSPDAARHVFASIMAGARPLFLDGTPEKGALDESHGV